MRILKKAALAAMTAAICINCMAPAYAADEEKISKIDLAFEIEKPVSGETVEDTLIVTTTTENITIDDAYYDNDVDEWERGDIPTIKVAITANDGYYFNSLKLSRVSGLTAKSKSIKKDDDKYHAIATIKLKAVAGDLDTPEDVDWSGYVAQWEDVDGASYYSARLYRDDKRVTTITTDDTEFDFYPWMTRSGDYTFDVKAKATKTADDSDWSEESDAVDVSSSQTYSGTAPTQTNYRGSSSSSNNSNNSSSYNYSNGSTNYYSNNYGPGANTSSANSQSGTSYGTSWQHDGTGWKYYQNNNQVYYSWVRDNNIWYLIGQNGYMQTGWQQVNGQWFYLSEKVGDPLGKMVTGWAFVNGKWYWLSNAESNLGVMMTGYQTINNNIYYFQEDGSLLINGTAPNGKTSGMDGILR